MKLKENYIVAISNFFFHPYYIAELKFETFLVRLLPIDFKKNSTLKIKVQASLFPFEYFFKKYRT